MISIIKIITDNYRPFRLGSISPEERAQKINGASKRVIYCGGILSEAESAAIVSKFVNGNLKSVAVFLSRDCHNNADTLEELNALKILLNAEIIPDLRYEWGFNFLILDNVSYVFGKEIDALDPKYNCLILDLGETETLLKSVFSLEETKNAEQEQSIQPAKIEELKKEIDVQEEKLVNRKRYDFLSSRIEIISCHLEGIRFLDKTVPLNSPLFVFSSKEAKNKFKASYRLFDKFEKKVAYNKCFEIQEKIKDDLRFIKNKYLKNTSFGDCILTINKESFSKEIGEFNKKLSNNKDALTKDLDLLVDESVEALKRLLKDFIEQRTIKIQREDYFKSADKELIINDILRSLKVPTAKEMATNLKVDFWNTRLSPELCENKKFLEQVKGKFEPGLSGYER
ncbi:MAG: hypothetical protein A2Y06_07600 [Omnitrophica WOR_2 bacterium GWA2_37_7]|nr:MAG: hypothetical protein A2Y06_07600 [Omnitrophica WOR_2 bacterium GWA2_37_7]HAE36746.1 hypothetical protein [Candidatus Nomurabacteria bacterium]